MGIITLLANVLRGAAGAPQPSRTKPPLVELYGPAGLRTFVRSILKMTSTELTDRYAVHELLTPADLPTSCALADLNPGEAGGRDILCVSTGLWFDFAVTGNIHVDAGPLEHRAPCIGYVFRELGENGRKLVVLGDTCDPSPVLDLAQNATLLIHEATDAHIPVEIDRALRGDKKTPEVILTKTVAKGHSTPGMAGAFAKAIDARMLVLNHFSGKFPAPLANRHDRRRLVMGEIERQASAEWGKGRALAAYDFLRVDIPGVWLPQQPDSHSRFLEPSFDIDDAPRSSGPSLPSRPPAVGPRNVLKRRKT